MVCLKDADALIQDLDTTDIGLNQRAQATLVLLGESVVEHLIAVLQTGSVRQRSNAVLVLGKIGDAKAFESLCHLRTDPSLAIRVNNASAIGFINTPQAVNSLVDWLEWEDEPIVQSMIVKSLAAKQDRRCTMPLLEALKRKGSPSVRYLIIRALGNLGDPIAIDSILPFVNDADHHVKHDARLALEKLGYCVR